MMYKAWENGISPHEFRKCQLRDLKDLKDIKDEMDLRAMREEKVREMMAKMRK